MEESEAKFYVSQVVLALEYIHNLDIIYRDLKLENLLIDSRGFIKLIDFGFAKRVDSSTKSWTLCGTPDYLAPEVILAQGYTKAADWWAVGVLTWELVVGRTPWTSVRGGKWRQIEIYEEILQGGFVCPTSFSCELVTFVTRLLERRPEVRLGSNGEVRDQSWLEDVAWDEVWARTHPVPYLPRQRIYNDVNHNRCQEDLKCF